MFVTRSERGDVFLTDYIDSWASWIDRFVKEASGSVAPYLVSYWGAYDWIGALHARDFLQQSLEELQIRDPVATIEVTDELFRRFTVPDEARALRLSGMTDLPDAPWWWQRVPAAGPVADELAAWLREAQDG